MPLRDFQIYGPAMIAVNFGGHIPISPHLSGFASGAPLTQLSDLGLCTDAINIHLNFRHKNIMTDAYGPEIPIDQQWMLADAVVTTRLIHWNPEILELCLREAMGGGADPTSATDSAGSCNLAGTIMGGGNQAPKFNEPFVPGSGYHYVSLNIIPQPNIGTLPWRFPSSYLTGRPVIIPIGTERTIAECTWRAIPYGVVPNQASVILSGFPSPGGTFIPGLTITTVVSRPDANAIGTSIEPVFVWDHTLDEAIIGGP